MMASVAPMRVLVVDDDDDSAMTLAVLLMHYGHETETARGGKAALRQAPLFHPDVCLIDLAMPKVDGLTVARQLRRTPEFAETPLIAVSGYVDARHRAQAAAAGFNGFLGKPYALVELQETMQRVAARVSASRELVRATRDAADETRHFSEAARREVNDFLAAPA